MFSLVPYSPAERRFSRFFDELDRELMKPEKEFFGIRTDIKEEKECYLLEAELPGFDKKDVSVDVRDGVLTISAKRDEKKETGEGGYITRERRTGSFKRSFDLAGIDEGGIKGAYKDGVLSLTLPKSKEIEPETKKIELE